jgi:hypothetical protein
MRAQAWLIASSLAVPAGAQTLADQVSGCLGNPPTATIDANPSNYRTLLPTLQPGQRLRLAAGTYTQGLPIDGLAGALGQCITIEGPATPPRAVFTARDCCNTVSLSNARFIAIRHLELDGQGRAVDAVKAESPATSVHHVLLEDLHIFGHGADQQVVGISTKCPAWNWVVRTSVIEGAGTGLYLGDSNGGAEFVGGLIEHNLVRDTIGYNMQVKHQTGRNTGIGVPASARTVVRHNVFSKASGASTGDDARPNLLVGHFPLTGPGSTDVYEIYGNLFHQNPAEALFQGEGNVALYDNLFLNDFDSGFAGVALQPQNDVPRDVRVFHNTVIARGTGIRVTGGAAGFVQRVVANLALAGTGAPPIVGGTQADNLTDTYAARATYLQAPSGPIGAGLSLFPRPGQVAGPPPDMTPFQSLRDFDRDFNAVLRGAQFRGGYAGEGTNPGWPLALAIKRPGDLLPVELLGFAIED